MSISGIHPYGVDSPFYDPWSPIDPPKEKSAVRNLPVEYSNDSIEEAKKSKDNWAVLYAGSAGSRPNLEAPLLDAKKIPSVVEEIGQFVPKMTEAQRQASTSEQSLAETTLLMMFIACMKTQRENTETDAEMTFDLVQRRQDANKQIKDEYFNKLDEHISKQKQSKILSWVNWIMWGGLASVGVASLALTIATAGAALPAAVTITMTLTNAALALGSGSTTIFKGVLDHNNKKTLGTLEEKRFERTLNNDKIKTGMEEMQQSMTAVSDNWKELNNVVNNWLEASLNR